MNITWIREDQIVRAKREGMSEKGTAARERERRERAKARAQDEAITLRERLSAGKLCDSGTASKLDLA